MNTFAIIPNTQESNKVQMSNKMKESENIPSIACICIFH